MVPHRLARETFGLFRAIPTARLDDDIAEGAEGYEPARLRTVEFYNTEAADRTAVQCSEYPHAQMIQACAARADNYQHHAAAFWIMLVCAIIVHTIRVIDRRHNRRTCCGQGKLLAALIVVVVSLQDEVHFFGHE